MKCLSLWQPWATLIAIGAKSIETRSWYTPYRGPILIHAAKKRSGDLIEMCGDEPFYSVLNKSMEGPWRHDEKLFRMLPLGAIVAVADLADCAEMAVSDRGSVLLPRGYALTDQERAFGNYYPGRYAWLLTNVRRFPTPIPCTGHQGIFNVPDELVAAQLAALREVPTDYLRPDAWVEQLQEDAAS